MHLSTIEYATLFSIYKMMSYLLSIASKTNNTPYYHPYLIRKFSEQYFRLGVEKDEVIRVLTDLSRTMASQIPPLPAPHSFESDEKRRVVYLERENSEIMQHSDLIGEWLEDLYRPGVVPSEPPDKIPEFALPMTIRFHANLLDGRDRLYQIVYFAYQAITEKLSIDINRGWISSQEKNGYLIELSKEYLNDGLDVHLISQVLSDVQTSIQTTLSHLAQSETNRTNVQVSETASLRLDLVNDLQDWLQNVNSNN